MSDGDGRRRVQLTPPPRVDPVGASTAGSPEGERRGAGARRRIVLGGVVLAVVLGGAGALLLVPGNGPSGTDPLAPERGVPLPAEDPGGGGALQPGADGVAGSSGRLSPPRELPAAAEIGPPPPRAAPAERRSSALPRAPAPPPSALPPPAPPSDPTTEVLEQLEGLRARAAQHERAEAWEEAETAYAEALQIEPTATFARAGVRRAGERAELARRLERQLAAPDRLAAEAVLEEARSLLEVATSVEAPGARHRGQVEALAALVAAAATPVKVELISDGETEVVVHHVGRLGRFSRRELELRPGLYTVVGSRRGYRDVRLELRVEPRRSPPPLVVRCREEV